jgi:uncharacterized protein (TIGR03118 family)
MAYLQFNDYYRIMLLSGRLPYPYPYPCQSPYIHSAPNLTNENCEFGLLGPIENDQYYPWHLQYNSYMTSGISCCVNDCFIPYQDPSTAQNFILINLVSNIFTAARNIDLALSDPWGIVVVDDIIWVANAITGVITKYNLLGGLIGPPISVFGPFFNIGQPTGIVFNSNIDVFPLVKGPITESASIIVCTRDGTINGYNHEIDIYSTAILIDNSADKSIYTGLELVDDTLFVADFYNQRIDVYDKHLNRIMLNKFIDDSDDNPIPQDFAPYNIVNIGDVFYVTYARQNPKDNQFEIFGAGFGYINIFSLDGNFIRRFASKYCLNAPWDIIRAPSRFGYPAGALLVSNFGDNVVGVYDQCGAYIGNISDKNGNDLYISGVRGLCINTYHDEIVYFTSRENNLKEAYVGSINIGSEIL